MLNCPSASASELKSASFPPVCSDNVLHSSCHQFWPSFLCLCSSHIPKPKGIRLHVSSRNRVIFIIGLVNSSPNVVFMVVAKRFSYGLVTLNYFGLCNVWRIVNELFCSICTKRLSSGNLTTVPIFLQVFHYFAF